MVDRREFIVGEVFDGIIYIAALNTSSHVGRCARFARKLTESSSSVVMEDGGGHVVVCQHPSATICSGEVLYSYVVTYRS